MNWLFFALLGPAIYVIINFIDKYIISRKIKDYSAMPIFGSITGFVIGLLFWALSNYPILQPFDALILILSGVFTIWGTVFYFKALSSEEASNVVLFFQAIPLMVLVLSIIFLHESLTTVQGFGFLIILAATTYALKKTGGARFRLNKALILVLIADAFWAVAAVLVTLAINANSFTEILSYESWGIGVGGLILYLFFPKKRRAFHKTVQTAGLKIIFIVFVNEVIFVIAKSVTYYAYSLGPTAQVSVLGGTQVLFGVLYGWFLTKKFPKIFKEDIRRSTLIKKFILAIFTVFGILLIT
ncbi:MAG: EamA family transporter [Microgenomates group bacterium]|jgi:drug/metabolite transporter (DMT)-like permease|nr:DMT family transporter [Candidatus Woesebacteria bacterium]MBP6883213.1 DMT family transporter [Candidatus Woesebacteria bacterium]QQR63932.1 MAG: DMT family transporter [Candidatus Roizmanbacteria bacterium]